MIVRARYRDCDFDELDGCMKNVSSEIRADYVSRWDATRGKPILIRTPASSSELDTRCVQPHYAVVNEAGEQLSISTGQLVSACLCVAEIGD